MMTMTVKAIKCVSMEIAETKWKHNDSRDLDCSTYNIDLINYISTNNNGKLCTYVIFQLNANPLVSFINEHFK